MAYETLILTDKEDTRIITINRPQVLNAINKKVLLELKQVFTEAQDNKNILAIILTGAGEKSFVAGADISEMKSLSALEAAKFSSLGQNVFNLISHLKIPVIAAINGYALGGGLELALACDFMYAAENASFGLVETKLGLVPGFGGCARLVKRVGISYAKEMIFCASTINSTEALRVGLINKILKDYEVVEYARNVAQKIAQRGPLAISLAKSVLNHADDADLNTIFALERTNFGLAFSSKDHKEGIEAFLEKRNPSFEGI